MNEALYDELVPFYHLLDPLEDHAEEAEELGGLLRSVVPMGKRFLELGSGAGHGAHFIKRIFEEVTLTDLSPGMLGRSQELNDDCEHRLGDMRSLRLGSLYDCVLIHDAIAYLVSVEEIRAAAATVAAHLNPGGAALLVPDCVKESFQEHHEDHAGDDEERSLRCISWTRDPDPADSTCVTDFAFLLREKGKALHAVHDQHLFGLFDTQTWKHACEAEGLSVEVVARPLPEEYLGFGYAEHMFLCRKTK